jgi:hypothetical protein
LIVLGRGHTMMGRVRRDPFACILADDFFLIV